MQGNNGPVMAFEWFFLALAVVLCVLSWGVFCAHEWARRAVIVLGLLAVAAMLASIPYTAFHEIGRIPEFANEVTPEARAWQICFVIRSAGLTCCLAAPFTLLVCLLAHPDVARSFTSRTTNAI